MHSNIMTGAESLVHTLVSGGSKFASPIQVRQRYISWLLSIALREFDAS